MRWHPALLSLALVFPASAHATYSIVAVDHATNQVGGSTTSCVGSSGVARVYGSAPGIGAVHAQARSNRDARDEAVRLLLGGASPDAIMAAITARGFDLIASQRQYGIVSLTGDAAGFTGADTLAFADDLQGIVGTYEYAIQGNILTSSRVLTQSQMGFEAPACDLAAHLMRALEAGADGGEGDSRCTPRGIPSDAAFIQVDLPGEPAGNYLSISIAGSGSRDPVALVRDQFDEWRTAHPCPAPPDAGVDAGASIADAGSQDPPLDASALDASTDAGATRGADSGTGHGLESSCSIGRPGHHSSAWWLGVVIAGVTLVVRRRNMVRRRNAR